MVISLLCSVEQIPGLPWSPLFLPDYTRREEPVSLVSAHKACLRYTDLSSVAPASFGADKVEGSRGEAMSWAESENIPAEGGCSSRHSCPGTNARLSEVL